MAAADVHALCKGVGVTFDLTGVAERIRGHAAEWQSLSLGWTHSEISPNYGKATTQAKFEGAGWLGAISVWATGETDLETVRTSDGLGVNKHYDLADPAELEDVLSERHCCVDPG